MNKVLASLLLFFIGLNPIFAQDFSRVYAVEKVEKSAWYKIPLNEDLLGNAKFDYTDIRLFSTNDSLLEIPYLLQEELPQTPSTCFVPFGIEVTSQKGVQQVLVQTDGSNLNTLLLKVGNHKNARVFSLAGSHDKKEWFGISDSEFLPVTLQNLETFYWHRLYFPSTKYAFLRLQFLDSTQAKIEIISVGGSVFSKAEKQPILPLVGIQYLIEHLPNKTSMIKVFSKQKQWIHQMAFSIKNPMFYSREVSLYTKELVQAKRRKKVWQETGVGHFELRAHSNQSFALNHYLDDTLYIAIDNQDNMPLPIAEILFFQRAIHLFAYLEEDKLYLLKCGNTALSKPQYDLSSFAKLIQDSVARSLHYSLVPTTTETQIAVKEVPFYEQKYFLWICIFVGAITLFFFSWKLLQEKKNGE
ncbi:MAG: hypothetical protein Q8R57_14355 [Bacteroidota bacterium]|nr:hypothetical protein [Bacteroidota bacterium]